MKYFALITASWTLICCPIIGNHSDSIDSGSIDSIQYISQTSSAETQFYEVNAFLKLEQLRGILYRRKRNHVKSLEQDTYVAYLYVILFRIHEKDTAAEKEFDTVLQLILDHVQIQISANAIKTRKFSFKNVSKFFFSWNTKISSDLSQMFWNNCSRKNII